MPCYQGRIDENRCLYDSELSMMGLLEDESVVRFACQGFAPSRSCPNAWSLRLTIENGSCSAYRRSSRLGSDGVQDQDTGY